MPDIFAILGLSPAGDADQMRQRAASIRSHIEELMTLAQHVDTTLAALMFEGPAASAMRTRLRDVGGETARTAERLDALATYLLQAAASTDDAQVEWRRRVDALERHARKIGDR